MMRKEAEWRKVVEDQSTSGLSTAAYCRERGIREKSLYYWKKRLRTERTAQFVPLTRQTETIRVASGTVTIEVSAGLAPSALETIVRALRASD